MTMNETTFNRIRELVYARSGISLGDNKLALVKARIAKRMRHLRLDDYGDYLQYAMDDTTGDEIQQMLDAISTNVTSFYREPAHFDILRKIVEEQLGKKNRALRFWSAACSSGEEPYTMAIEALEAAQPRSLDLRILGTDISTRVLENAMRGEYSADKLEPVPPIYRSKYFEVKSGSEKKLYTVGETLRKIVTFRQFNLMSAPFPMRKPLDIIFCRNVMIYFDYSARRRIVDEFYRHLKPGGYLMVGHAESVSGLHEGFRCIKPSIYIRE